MISFPPRTRPWIALATVAAIVALKELPFYVYSRWAGLAIFAGMLAIGTIGALLTMQNAGRWERRGLIFTLALCAGIAFCTRFGVFMSGVREEITCIMSLLPMAIYVFVMRKSQYPSHGTAESDRIVKQAPPVNPSAPTPDATSESN